MKLTILSDSIASNIIAMHVNEKYLYAPIELKLTYSRVFLAELDDITIRPVDLINPCCGAGLRLATTLTINLTELM